MKANYPFDATVEAIIARFCARMPEGISIEERGMCIVVTGPYFRIERCLGFFGTHLTIPRWELHTFPRGSAILYRYAGSRKQWQQDADWWLGQYDPKCSLKQRGRPRLAYEYRTAQDHSGKDSSFTPEETFQAADDSLCQYVPRPERPFERQRFACGEIYLKFDSWLRHNVLNQSEFPARTPSPEHTRRDDWQVPSSPVGGTIFTDINETLVSVKELACPPKDCCVRQPRVTIAEIGGNWYQIVTRPSTRLFLREARQVAPVYALTRLDASFQARILSAAGLELDGVYGQDNYEKIPLNSDRFVLVDDMPRGSPPLRTKLSWLGVKESDLDAKAASSCLRCIAFDGLCDPLPLWHMLPAIHQMLARERVADRWMLER